MAAASAASFLALAVAHHRSGGGGRRSVTAWWRGCAAIALGSYLLLCGEDSVRAVAKKEGGLKTVTCTLLRDGGRGVRKERRETSAQRGERRRRASGWLACGEISKGSYSHQPYGKGLALTWRSDNVANVGINRNDF